jgi:hypothetical protein
MKNIVRGNSRMGLDELSLSEIRTIPTWQSAALGCLLLVNIGVRTEMCFRWDWPAANGVAKSLLIITGDNHGKTVGDGNVEAPALDISELVEIVAKKPSPFSSVSAIKPGMLFEFNGGFYVWFTPMYGSGQGFVCISHKTSPNLIGGYVLGLKPERIGISHSIDIRRTRFNV